jgi:hypothetical protein
LVLRDHEVAARKHTGGKVGGVEGRTVEVPDHNIRFPPTHETDNQRIDISAKQRHGAPGAKGTGADVGLRKTQRSTNKTTAGAKRKGQVRTRDIDATPCWQENSEQRSERMGKMTSKMLNTTSNGLHRGQKRVPCITMGDTLISFPILLCSEVKIDAHGSAERSVINGGAVKGSRAQDFKRSITKAKRMTAATAIGMLTGTEQIKIANKEQVANGRLERIRRILGIDRVAGEGQRNGLHPHGRRVARTPGTLKLLKWQHNMARRI